MGRAFVHSMRAVAASIALAVLAMGFGAMAASLDERANSPGQPLTLMADTHAGEVVVPVNKSQVLRVDRKFTDILVGNPKIADVMPLTDRSIYILGKELGSTNLTVYGPGRRLIAVVDLVVSYDAEGLKMRLHDMMPGERIEVRGVNGALVLSGSVSTARQLDRALAIAERYAPGAVTNLLTVTGSQQVMLQVKVAEMRRSVARALGITNINIGKLGGSELDTVPSMPEGGELPGLLTGIINPTAFLALGVGVLDETFFLDVAFEALEEKGALRTLAEPNLIALSGDTADFLAGGEFPIPVAQDDNTITVEFKPFGVGLTFTPTVLDDNLINLTVAPEVSQVDQTDAVRVGTIVLPSFTTRRARTTVELRDGQSFAIAGLLQNDFQDRIEQVPGLGDLPVLGALFRSTEFQRNETELVIVVTPRLVQPAAPEDLALPTDNFVPPSNMELFLLGRIEGEGPPGGEEAEALGTRPGGGISGPYGHILQ